MTLLFSTIAPEKYQRRHYSDMRSFLRFSLILLCFLTFLVWVDWMMPQGNLKNFLQSSSVPSELLCYNKLGELFVRLGIIDFIPNDEDHDSTVKNVRPDDPPESFFSKRRKVSNVLITTNTGNNELQKLSQNIPAAAFMEEELIISIATNDESLHGEKGIITNYSSHGKKWERFSHVTIFKGNTKIFSSAAGLRLHGGKSRNPGQKFHSYRLYFRSKYGQREIPENLGVIPGSTIQTLVVHLNTPVNWPMNSVIANDLYRRLGSNTMSYLPAAFYLNGNYQGVYWISEHLSEKYLRKHLNTDTFVFFRYRTNDAFKKTEYKEELARFVYDYETPLLQENIQKHINIDDLTNFYIAVSFCGTTDWDQGVAYRLQDTEDSLWRWIVWDVDHSFIDWYGKNNTSPNYQHWKQKGLGLVLDRKRKMRDGIRNVLFRRLFKEDKKYRNYFLKRYTDALNHLLSEEQLSKLFTRYDEQARRMGLTGMNPGLEEFFIHRPHYMRSKLQRYIQSPAWKQLIVTTSDTVLLEIDGFRVQGNYKGYYPANRKASLTIPGKSHDIFLHWLVNKEIIPNQSIEIDMIHDTMVEPVFSSTQSKLQSNPSNL